MPRKAWFMLFVVFISAQNFSRAQSVKKIMARAKMRYVGMESREVKVGKNGARNFAGDDEAQATGFRIGGNYVLTNAHVCKRENECKVDGRSAKLVKDADLKADLALLTVQFPNPVPWVKLADAEVGDTVFGWSNADGLGGFFSHYFVARVDRSYLYLQEITIPGSSGTGLVSRKGRLVGLGMATRIRESGEGLYSKAVPASAIREYLKGIMPDD